MILDPIVKAFLALAGITSNLREPAAAVVSYALLDAQTNQPALFVRNGTVYDGSGNIVGAMNSDGSFQARKKTVAIAADGAVTVQPSTVIITKSASGAALTLGSPVATTDDGTEIDFVSTTAQAHTVTNTAGFGGGTTARDVATFGGAINDGFRIVAYQGVWYVKDTRNVTLG